MSKRRRPKKLRARSYDYFYSGDEAEREEDNEEVEDHQEFSAAPWVVQARTSISTVEDELVDERSANNFVYVPDRYKGRPYGKDKSRPRRSSALKTNRKRAKDESTEETSWNS